MAIGKLTEFLRTLEKQALEIGRKEERPGHQGQSCEDPADNTSEHWIPELTRTPVDTGHNGGPTAMVAIQK